MMAVMTTTGASVPSRDPSRQGGNLICELWDAVVKEYFAMVIWR